MKHYEYKTQGVCAQKIDFDIEGNLIRNVVFTGGCNGNLKAIAALVEGKQADEIAQILTGIRCGGRQTSCADQFARAIREICEKNSRKGDFSIDSEKK